MRDRVRELYRRRCGLLYGVLALIIVLCVLFAGEEIGMSNNGDFGRVMRAASLDYGQRLPSFTYADAYTIDLSHGSAAANVRAILFGHEGLSRYPSIHVGVVRLSVVANLVLNKLTGVEIGLYRMWVLGAIYAVLYAVGIGLLLSQFRLRRLWQDVLVKGAALVMLCDLGYVAYFNSLYGEGLEHIALVYCAAMLVRLLTHKPGRWDGLWCAVCAVVYGWTKFFNIPLACLMVVVMEGMIWVRTKNRRAIAFGGGALALLLAVWTAVPGWMDVETNYNAVFYGVIRNVDEATAKEYLADLGLPQELSDYRDTNYYLGGLLSSLEERGLREQAESVTKGDLIGFYLTHPQRLWHQAKLTAMHCGMIRPYYMANHGAGYPLMTFSHRMSLWSGLRDLLALDTLAGNLVATAAFMAAVIGVYRKKTKLLWLALPLAALLAGLAYAYILPVMLNGEGDWAKHMFAYVELVDLLLLGLFAMAVDRAGGKGADGVVCFVAAGTLTLLLLPPAVHKAYNLIRANTACDKLGIGAYVTLGSYGGDSLTWLVAAEREERLVLWCMDERIVESFDQSGDNDWRFSSARRWLNSGFLDGFSQPERAMLRAVDNTVLLNNYVREDAQAGDLDFSCSHIAMLADRGYDRAYQAVVEDVVTLPDIDLVSGLAREGYDVSGAAYWLETPYCASQNLTRYMAPDGHVYFGAAEVARVLRPTVEVGADIAVAGGSGSRRNPFVLAAEAVP